MERYPANHCSFISALQSSIAQDQTVVLRGPEADMRRWRDALCQGYQPWLTVFCLPYDMGGPIPNYLPSLVGAATRNQVNAFIFEDGQASGAITDLEALQRTLNGT